MSPGFLATVLPGVPDQESQAAKGCRVQKAGEEVWVFSYQCLEDQPIAPLFSPSRCLEREGAPEENQVRGYQKAAPLRDGKHVRAQIPSPPRVCGPLKKAGVEDMTFPGRNVGSALTALHICTIEHACRHTRIVSGPWP